MDLRLAGCQFGHDPAETQRILAERGSHPVIAGRRRVAFVEDEIDDLEHRRQASLEVGAPRHFEGHVRVSEGPLGPHDPLRDRRFRHEERTCDLVGSETAEQSQRERHACFGGEHRMARDEHESQQVVADVIVDCGVEVRRRFLPVVQLAAQLLVFALEQLVAAQVIDRAMLRGAHEPRAGIDRNARLGPFLERGDERVLRQILGDADVADNAREAGDQLRRLDSPDRVDRAVRVCGRHG